MTKSELQAELKSKLKAGIKPSDLRLKRSKSAGDIASNPPSSLLLEQLKEKQKEIEELRKKGEESAKQIEALNQELKETKQELDNSLQARVQGIKTFGSEHEKRTKAEKELNETIDEASEELVSSDKQVSSLRVKLNQAQQEISKLKKALENKQRKEDLTSTNSPQPEWITFPGSLVWLVLSLSVLMILKVKE